MADALVSIIMPAYNSERYIIETISSVQRQSYINWELLVVDDGSTDNTGEIVKKLREKDTRIKLFCQKNAGAATARNKALANSSGRFIAYLDADDIWDSEKLQKQIDFMIKQKCGFSCTSYEVISETGKPLNKYIHMLPQMSYKGFLTNNLLQTVGIMIDTDIVKKEYLVMPNMRRRQDAATWLQILKAGYNCYGINDILAKYRRAEGSLSSNKLKAVKGVWYLYRKVERLSIPFSCYCFVRYAGLAVWKRIYVGHIISSVILKNSDNKKKCFEK